ncbi:hypothetical protein QS460_04225 [Liquorilactobacillus mali]|uniref:hypothetical protein n=1 Tax=Liquorilactobacillus mali TaxID=1618 RepID=UPI00264F2D91|nr:hypothetical protein [Liquorilactobacillus mali]MDN7145133.1 hypothetical protein [Liquorilactobacillus mali]
MKKIYLLGLIATSSLLFAACKNNNSVNKNSNSSKEKSENIMTKKSSKKVASIALKKKKESESISKAESESKIKLEAKNKTITSNSSSQNSQFTSAQSAQVQPSSSSPISYDENTLTGFLNKYGMSPVAYKIKYEGMSEYDALKSTPNDMKDSGEMQTEYMMDQGYLDHNGQPTNKTQQNAEESTESSSSDGGN